jgi:GT2 family glycosyltransferase
MKHDVYKEIYFSRFVMGLTFKIQKSIILRLSVFDQNWYISNYPDVKESNLVPIDHFIIYGSKEGRKPNGEFPIFSYITRYKKLHQFINVIIIAKIEKYFCKTTTSKPFQRIVSDLTQKRNANMNPFKWSRLRFFVFILLNMKIRFYDSSEPKFSIIIVSWNTPALLLAQLKNFSRQKDGIFEIVIVDNGSSKLTQMLLNRISGINIKLNSSNLGYPKGVNQGLKLTKAPIVILLNSDAIPLGNWTDALLKDFSDPKIKILGAKIIDSNFRIQESGNLLWNDGVCQRIGINYSIDNFRVNRLGITDFCSACFLAIDKTVLTDESIFDESFSPAYYEDVDFALNMKNKGFDTYYDPSITVFHLENASSDANFAQEQININWKKFVAKNIDLLHNLGVRTQDIDLNEEIVTTQRMKNQILLIDSLFPSEINGQGAPRQKEIVNVLSNDRNYVDVLFRQGQYEIISDSFPILPTGILEISGPLNDEFLKLAIESKYKSKNIFWISRLENLLWTKENGFLEKFLDQGEVIFDFEAVRVEDLKPDIISILKSVNQILVVNEIDRNILKTYAITSTIVGFEPRDFFKQEVTEKIEEIVFVGNLENIESDNFQSLLAFRQSLSDHSKHAEHEILQNLAVYGKCTQESRKELEKIGFNLKGTKISMNDILLNAKIFIAPSLNPRGLPLKLKTARLYNIPCVITEVLARQLDWKNNIDAFIASNEYDFIEIILKLLKNDDFRITFAKKLKLENNAEENYVSFKKSVLGLFS